jgi:hypothetical protein
MAVGPCQAGFAGTHYYIYLGGGGGRVELPPFKSLGPLGNKAFDRQNPEMSQKAL